MTSAALVLALIAAAPAASDEPAARTPVLLDFHADWCGPCQRMRPLVQQLARTGYPIRSIDIDESPELAERYQITAVPAFVVVDGRGRALARSGPVPSATQLAQFYNEAAVKARPAARPKAQLASAESEADAPAPDATGPDAGREPGSGRSEGAGPARRAATNPDPWKSVVRIKVDSGRLIGFGSGTIIHSTPDESVILTCAHIFKTGGKQPSPSRFPHKVRVDLFDGVLRGQQVLYANETYEAEVIDYDFPRDVGLIRIRPGRRLHASRVVPASWQPKSGMSMRTVGCSEGNDATAWSTVIVRPYTKFQNSPYEAIECQSAPKQGRSGGGLFTDDGYVAGVCDFAEPRGDHGLYATPRSIHYLLDRNRLTALYTPPSDQPQTLLADRAGGTPGVGQPAAPARTPVRGALAQSQPQPALTPAQSPDEDGEVQIPDPDLLGVKLTDIEGAAGQRQPTASASATAAGDRGWRPQSGPVGAVVQQVGQRIDAAADGDDFATPLPAVIDPASQAGAVGANPEGEAAPASNRPAAAPARSWRPVKSPLPALAGDKR